MSSELTVQGIQAIQTWDRVRALAGEEGLIGDKGELVFRYIGYARTR